MGASVWHDAQIEKLQAHPPRTKRGRPVKRVATYVLDDLRTIAEAYVPNIRGKADDKLRKDFVHLFSRGGQLRSIVKGTGLGILFRENVW